MGTTPQADTADHHYVPDFYLKGFMDKQKRLWVYEKGGNAPRESKPKYEGHRENYYVFTEGGKANDSAEKMLSKVESIVAPIFRKLANKQFTMSEKELGNLYAFAALAFVRVPSYRELMDRQAGLMMKRYAQDRAKSPEKFDELIRGYELKTGKPVEDRDALRKVILGDGYTIEQKSAAFNLLGMLISSMEITAVLAQEYRYDLYYAPAGSYFVTCDNPIITIGPDSRKVATVGLGFGWKQTEVVFPINKRACLIFRRNGRQLRIDASEEWMKQTNDLMMFTAQKYLYAPEGTRRMARIFTERGSKIKYGENAFVANNLPAI